MRRLKRRIEALEASNAPLDSVRLHLIAQRAGITQVNAVLAFEAAKDKLGPDGGLIFLVGVSPAAQAGS